MKADQIDGNSVLNFTGYLNNGVEYIKDRQKEIQSSLNLNNTQNAIANLEEIIQRYELTMNAFKLHYFPIAPEFLKSHNLPNESSTNDIEELAMQLADIIEDLYHAILPDSKLSRIIGNYGFTDSFVSFYKWKYADIKTEINQLLDGNKITLKPNITKGPDDSAIKFNTIMIRLLIPNPQHSMEIKESQKQLDRILSNFRIIMTTKILSNKQYFRCGKDIYSIPFVEGWSMSYSLDSEVPYTYNESFEMLRKNRAYQSPYTTWAFKLVLHNRADEINWVKLREFKNRRLNLELNGEGSYMIEADDVAEWGAFSSHYCGDHLDKYYDRETDVFN